MKSIAIKNLRGLVDTGEVELKPITLLLGANSTGKSSFLRLFPLLKQGLHVNKQGPLLWYGSEVDFGSYQTAVRKGQSFIELAFRWEILPAGYYSSRRELLNDVALCVRIEAHDDDAYIEEFTINIAELEIFCKLTNGGMSTSILRINGEDYSRYPFVEPITMFRDNDGIIPVLLLRPQKNMEDNSFLSQFFSRMSVLFPSLNLTADTYHYDSDDFRIGTLSAFKESLCEKFNVEMMDLSTDQESALVSLNNMIVLDCLDDICSSINLAFQREMEMLYYIKPFRASAERYYRVQNLSINRLDSDGHNMAIFVHNMYKNSAKKRDFKAWTSECFGFVLDAKMDGGHISLSISDGESENNITDKGFGYSQILPIILSLWQIKSGGDLSSRRRGTSHSLIVAIEQPELHLHPKKQAEVLDAFISVIQSAREQHVDIKFIVETHSQTMVNRLGSKISDGEFAAQDASILLFNEGELACRNPQRSYYLSNGHLANWPIGFFNPNF